MCEDWGCSSSRTTATRVQGLKQLVFKDYIQLILFKDYSYSCLRTTVNFGHGLRLIVFRDYSYSCLRTTVNFGHGLSLIMFKGYS